MNAAVITADIVNSTSLSAAAHKKLIKQFEVLLNGHIHEFYRGDSFQALIKSPKDALPLLLQLRAAAIRFPQQNIKLKTDIRASIGIGKIKLPIRTLKTQTDEAFVLSGRAFDQIKTDQHLAICCHEEDITLNLAFNVLAQFIDYLFSRMSLKQAEVVFELLLNRTQTETAKRLKKSQATIHKHTQAAGWPEVEKLLKEYQLLVKTVH